jgi:uncharacterized Zn-binding protein involved in type VI secretion
LGHFSAGRWLSAPRPARRLPVAAPLPRSRVVLGCRSMPGVCRLGDKAKIDADAHGCPACPHKAIGPAVVGSGNVNVNGAPALRQGDMGIHAACCGPNLWHVIQASAKVFVNGQPMVRKGDTTQHCGGIGEMIEASGDVNDNSPKGPSVWEELAPRIAEWLKMVQDDGIAQLLFMISPGVGNAFFAAGEVGKFYDPDCRFPEYMEHLAKCFPGDPPFEMGPPKGPRPPAHPVPVPNRRPRIPNEAIEPVGLLDLDNPITFIVTAPVTGPVRGLQLGAKGGKWLGGKALGVADDVLGWAF